MKRLAAPALALFVAGCVSAPKQQPVDLHVEIPARYTRAGAAADPIAPDWWTEFRDPLLTELIRIAEEENRDLRGAAARLDRAAAEARIAGADLKPALGAGASGARQRQNFVGFPIETGGSVLSTTSDRFGVSLEASWEIDLWGRIRAGARAAVAEWQAGEADLRGARQSIAAQTAKAWFAVAESRQQLDLASNSTKSFRRVADQVRSRFEQGLRPALDLRLALSNLAVAEALLRQRGAQLDSATRQLEVLLGRYPAGSLLESFPVRALPDLPPPAPFGLPAELVSRRPDLVAAERRLAAADQRVAQSRRALYPRLSLTAAGGTVSDALQDLLDGDFRVWSLLGGLTQPLFQGGKLRAGVDLSEAGREEAIARYGSAVLKAFAEVESALAAERFLVEQHKHLAEASRQLAAARALAEERYRTGLGNYLVVLESQTRALGAESERIRLQRRLLTNRVDLHLALGGGWEASPRKDRPS